MRITHRDFRCFPRDEFICPYLSFIDYVNVVASSGGVSLSGEVCAVLVGTESA
jgi:hypothetical protein